MEEIKCIFCDIESHNTVIEEDGFKGRKCPQCGLIYISPRPSFDEIVDLYGHDDAHISAQAHISSDFLKRIYARHHLKRIRSFVRNGAFLEIGAGAGYFLDEARKTGFDPYALEFNPAQAAYIRNDLSIPCEESSLDTSLFGGKKFKVIYHCDVISHFFDPIADLLKMNEMLEKEGYLIFETGNGGDIDPKYFKYFRSFQYPEHLFFFSIKNLEDLLDKTGFELKKIYRYSTLPHLMAIKTVTRLGKRPAEFGAKKEVTGNNEISNPASTGQAKSLKAILKKSLKRMFHYSHYILRYKLGRIAPKGSRPQTLLVIAQKR